MNLYINTPGTYLHVREAMFEVRIRQEQTVKKHQFAAHKVSCILMSKGAALSTDAVALAMEYNVDIVFLQNSGQPYGRVWHAKLGSTTRIRKAQLEASLGEKGLIAIKDWLVAKLDRQADFLQHLKKHRQKLEPLLEEKKCLIGELAVKIKTAQGSSVAELADSIRGWEGNAGKHYFEALSQAIPPDFLFQGRSSRPARDAFNACLNYAYGILYSQVEKCLMIAGLDPYVGFLHRDDYNHKSLVYDFIEPYRIHAERVVFRLFSGKAFRKSYAEEIPGGISLNAEGKPVLVEAYHSYMLEQKVVHRGRKLNRLHIMQLEAHRFANDLIAGPYLDSDISVETINL